MTTLYVHISWFFSLLFLLLLSVLLSLYISYMGVSLHLSFSLFDVVWTDIKPSFYLDFISSWFFTTIVLISAIVSVYSYFYIAPYRKSVYFMWLTILFVLSMLLVVRMSSLFFVMLGWDGLGLVSFFLIVYYQNQSSITSGLFTLLINRLGDCFFLVTIVLFFYTSSDLFINSRSLPSLLCVSILILTFMTKRAIFPFSPWLPIAIAAPTPISALVHSSTLVTSGLFLMIRYSYYLFRSPSLMSLFFVLRVFTSFYAGMNTIFEKDLKKLIALSTLSHLGFIGIAFSLGLIYLSFFHMLSHALFKSLLFMTMGDIMINLSHSQDIRYLSKGSLYTPFSTIIMSVSLVNLLGLPNVSGFFSKDLVLESLNYSHLSSVMLGILFINVFFTFYYTLQLFYYSFSNNKLRPFSMFHRPIVSHSVLIFFLSLLTLIFGQLFISHLCQFTLFLVVPSIFKFFPFTLFILFFICLVVFLKLFTSFNSRIAYYFSSIMFLSEVCMKLSSFFYLKLVSESFKVLEAGSFNFVANFYPTHLSSLVSKSVFSYTLLNPLLVSFFACFFLCLFLSLLKPVRSNWK